MKKILTSVLALCLCLSFTQSVHAQDSGKAELIKTEIFVYDGTSYSCTVNRYESNTPNEYKIIIIQSNNYYLELDTRNDYLTENDETIHFCVSTFVENQNDRSHPTAIQHGLTLKPNYHYSYSTWTDVETERQVASMTVNAIVSLLIAYIPGMGNFSQTILSTVAQFLIDTAININYPNYNFDVRTYMYANIYVLSQFGKVRQNYLGDTPVMQGVVADSGMLQ